MGITPDPSINLMYVHEYNLHVSENEINVQFYAGMVCLFGFFRFLIALVVNETLGPIVSTISYMLRDISIFICIWFIVLVSFAMVSIMCF